MRAAAQQGNGHAQFDLATFYAQGVGTAQNLPRAVVWYSAAAVLLHGDEAAAASSGAQQAAGAMTAAQRQEAKQIAQACKNGNYKGCD
jgi:TPR repeat protein